jgi:hypothetical protein
MKSKITKRALKTNKSKKRLTKTKKIRKTPKLLKTKRNNKNKSKKHYDLKGGVVLTLKEINDKLTSENVDQPTRDLIYQILIGQKKVEDLNTQEINTYLDIFKKEIIRVRDLSDQQRKTHFDIITVNNKKTFDNLSKQGVSWEKNSQPSNRVYNSNNEDDYIEVEEVPELKIPPPIPSRETKSTKLIYGIANAKKIANKLREKKPNPPGYVPYNPRRPEESLYEQISNPNTKLTEGLYQEINNSRYGKTSRRTNSASSQIPPPLPPQRTQKSYKGRNTNPVYEDANAVLKRMEEENRAERQRQFAYLTKIDWGNSEPHVYGQTLTGPTPNVYGQTGGPQNIRSNPTYNLAAPNEFPYSRASQEEHQYNLAQPTTTPSTYGETGRKTDSGPHYGQTISGPSSNGAYGQTGRQPDQPSPYGQTGRSQTESPYGRTTTGPGRQKEIRRVFVSPGHKTVIANSSNDEYNENGNPITKKNTRLPNSGSTVVKNTSGLNLLNLGSTNTNRSVTGLALNPNLQKVVQLPNVEPPKPQKPSIKSRVLKVAREFGQKLAKGPKERALKIEEQIRAQEKARLSQGQQPPGGN